MPPTHYDTLGVDRNASQDEIKKAYRTMSLKWHPDRNPSEEAHTKFQEINLANEILSDEQKRQEYNNELDGIPNMPQHEIHMDGNMADFINMMFGGGGMGGPGGPGIHIFHGGPGGIPHFFQQFNKPPPIIRALELTLEQAYTGCTVCINIDRWIIRDNVRVTETEPIYIQVQQGIDNDEVIIIRDAGNKVNEELRGDVKFIVKMTNTTQYIRQGMDLLYKKTVSLKEALTGFTMEITHISGKPITINNNAAPSRAIVHPGFKYTVPGLGMMRNGNSGNLIIEFDVKFPKSLTDEQINKLSELL